MDIAKIRKKLKEKDAQQAEKKAPSASESPAELTPASIQSESYPEHLEPKPEPKEEQILEDIISEIKDSTKKEHPIEPAVGFIEKPYTDVRTKKTVTKKETGEKPKAESAEEEDIIELLIFKLSDEDYAFKVPDLEEILRSQKVTQVPRVEEFIIGITSLRGKMIPLIDLKKRFLLKDGVNRSKAKILILKGKKGSIGVLVDKVIDVARIPAQSIVNPPSHLTESELRFIEGVAFLDGRFISVVRLDEALNFKVGEK